MGARGPKPTDFTERNKRMRELYRDGYTLVQIGAMYGITRERVRQVTGLRRNDGGQHVGATINKAARLARRTERRDQRYKAKWSCDYATFVQLNEGRSTRRGLALRYHNQQHNAATRGIEWQFTFPEWVQIWRDSGHLHERGRTANAYVMARRGDVGPYSASNVYITTLAQNVRDYRASLRERGVVCPDGWVRLPEKGHKSDGKPPGNGAMRSARGWTYVKRLKTRPYQVVCGKRYVGSYATEAEARAAYLLAKSKAA